MYLEFTTVQMINWFLKISLNDILFLFISFLKWGFFNSGDGFLKFSHTIFLQYHLKEVTVFIDVFRRWFRVLREMCLNIYFYLIIIILTMSKIVLSNLLNRMSIKLRFRQRDLSAFFVKYFESGITNPLLIEP